MDHCDSIMLLHGASPFQGKIIAAVLNTIIIDTAGNLTMDDNRIFWPNSAVKLGAPMVESVCSRPCPKGQVKVLLRGTLIFNTFTLLASITFIFSTTYSIMLVILVTLVLLLPNTCFLHSPLSVVYGNDLRLTY